MHKKFRTRLIWDEIKEFQGNNTEFFICIRGVLNIGCYVVEVNLMVTRTYQTVLIHCSVCGLAFPKCSSLVLRRLVREEYFPDLAGVDS